jgi:hypothetical protein
VRKWTKSACVVLAWCIIVPILAAAGSQGPGRPAQANISIASYTQATLASQPATAIIVRTAGPTAARPAATWSVRPGDTLSAIATALGVPGGWQALYTLNRQAIGPNPDLVRPGTVLAVPRPAARGPAPRPPAPAPPPHQAAPTAPAGNPRQPSGLTAPSHATAPASGAKAPAGGMPRWLEDVLLAAGLLAASAFFVELAAALTHRRRAARHARPRALAAARDRAQCAATRARIILADHERLIVTYSTQDDTVYVLTPPGEDPQAVLRAARLILPENTYEELAGHLGVPSAWPLE